MLQHLHTILTGAAPWIDRNDPHVVEEVPYFLSQLALGEEEAGLLRASQTVCLYFFYMFR